MKSSKSLLFVGNFILPVLMVVFLCLALTGCGHPSPTLNQLEAARINHYDYLNAYLSTDRLVHDINYDSSTLYVDEERATCRGTLDTKLNEYFTIKGNATTVWLYNEDERTWDFSQDQISSVYSVLNTSVEGTWGIFEDSDSIYVDNQTEDSLDIYVENYDSFGDDWVHVTLNTYLDDDDQDTIINGHRGVAVYTGENADGQTIKVTFFMSIYDELGISVHAPTIGFFNTSDRFGYYRDFTPTDSNTSAFPSDRDEKPSTGTSAVGGSTSNTPIVTDPLASLDVGDIFSFGSYKQSSSSHSDEIEWIVLEKNSDKMLVISKYLLDSQPYHTKNQSVTWNSCSVRTWLNNSFYNTAFTTAEKEKILVSSDSATSLTDKIFLLSVEEAELYFPTKSDRICWATNYAIENDAYVNTSTGGSWWLLRTPGEDGNYVMSVNSDGTIDYEGGKVDSKRGTVRPAMWIKLG